jgi:hypothetical protein
MRKLFVIFLLVALVPFSVGCDIVDGDDDNPVTGPTSSTVTLNPSVTVPSTFAANMRAVALNALEIPMEFNGESYLPKVDTTTKSGYTILSYQIITTTEEIQQVTGQAFATSGLKIPVKFYAYGQPIKLEIDAPVYEPGSSVISSSANFEIRENAGKYFLADLDNQTEKEVTIDPTKGFYITSVKYGETNVSGDPTDPTIVSSLPTFKITFNQAPANLDSAEWSLKFSRVEVSYNYDDNHENYTEGSYSSSYDVKVISEFQLTGGKTNGYFTYSATDNVVTVSLKSGTEKQLTPGSTYKVEFVSTNLNSGDSEIPAAGSKYIRVPFEDEDQVQ